MALRPVVVVGFGVGLEVDSAPMDLTGQQWSIPYPLITEYPHRADGAALPLAIDVAAASPAAITLVEASLSRRSVRPLPKRPIGNEVYDSDALYAQLAELGVEIRAPNRENGILKSQDGRLCVATSIGGKSRG